MGLVLFDLGGVMVRVAYRWGQTMPGLDPRFDQVSMGECAEFEAYQAGRLSLDDYLVALAAFLGLDSKENALIAHNGILNEPFAGTLDLVEELHAAGVPTGCLSNTNAPHWETMKHSGRYPAIAALQTPILSHEVQAEKPGPEIYRIAEEKTGKQGADIIFFDDLEKNVQAARDRGWQAFRIDPDAHPAQQARRHLVDLGIL